MLPAECWGRETYFTRLLAYPAAGGIVSLGEEFVNASPIQLPLQFSRLMELTITNFPIPPTVNKLYAYVGGRMVKAKCYRDYERACYVWLTTNPQQVAQLRQFTRDIGSYVLHVDACFYMSKRSIVCLNGKPKKNDTSNRLKPLHDVLSSIIIGVDDSYFWSGSFTKFSVDDAVEPYVNIVLKLREI